MCSCKGKISDRYTVTLKSGLKITKSNKAAAEAYAAKHPGATIKPA